MEPFAGASTVLVEKDGVEAQCVVWRGNYKETGEEVPVQGVANLLPGQSRAERAPEVRQHS